MKFAYAKKDMQCNGCEAIIERGEPIVLNFASNRRNRSGVYVMPFHLLCYLPWYTNMFNRKYNEWINGDGNLAQRPKLGRPAVYSEPTRDQMLNRLRSNLSHSKKVGNKVKITMYSNKIAELLGKTG